MMSAIPRSMFIRTIARQKNAAHLPEQYVHEESMELPEEVENGNTLTKNAIVSLISKLGKW